MHAPLVPNPCYRGIKALFDARNISFCPVRLQTPLTGVPSQGPRLVGTPAFHMVSLVLEQNYERISGCSEGGKLSIKRWSRLRQARGKRPAARVARLARRARLVRFLSLACLAYAARLVRRALLRFTIHASRFTIPLCRREELHDDRVIHTGGRRTNFGEFGEGVKRGLVEQQTAG